MSVSLQRVGRSFAGMAFPDASPLVIAECDVQRVHMFDVPSPLREHAHESLGELSGGEWWTVGEFRYADESEYSTAVAKRVMVAGRMVVEYGVEI